jgi:hypothetical protein
MNRKRLQGGCFCGAVRYELDGFLERARACHCSRCRKAFNGASSAYAELTPSSSIEWVSGEAALTIFQTGESWAMGFCSKCGSTLCGMHNNRVHGLTLGCIDGDPGIELEMHIFVGSKAAWDHIGGHAIQYAEHAVIDQAGADRDA